MVLDLVMLCCAWVCAVPCLHAYEQLSAAPAAPQPSTFSLQSTPRFIAYALSAGLEASADALGRTIQQGAKARFGAGARQLQVCLLTHDQHAAAWQSSLCLCMDSGLLGVQELMHFTSL